MSEDLNGVVREELGRVYGIHPAILEIKPGEPSRVAMRLEFYKKNIGHKVIQYSFSDKGNGRYNITGQVPDEVHEYARNILLSSALEQMLKSYQGDYCDFRDIALEAIRYLRGMREAQAVSQEAEARTKRRVDKSRKGRQHIPTSKRKKVGVR